MSFHGFPYRASICFSSSRMPPNPVATKASHRRLVIISAFIFFPVGVVSQNLPKPADYATRLCKIDISSVFDRVISHSTPEHRGRRLFPILDLLPEFGRTQSSSRGSGSNEMLRAQPH